MALASVAQWRDASTRRARDPDLEIAGVVKFAERKIAGGFARPEGGSQAADFGLGPRPAIGVRLGGLRVLVGGVVIC